MATNTETRKAQIITDASQSEASINKLAAASRLLYNDLKKLERGSKEFKESVEKWKTFNTRLKQAEADVKGVDTAMGKLNKTHNTFWGNVKQIAVGTMAGNLFTFLGTAASGAVNNMIEGRKRISDEMTNIEKTTNMTKEEVKALDAELKKINTRTSRSELRQLAYEAGKLGIEGKENVRQFVEEMNQIKVALGEDLGEDAIIQIGKMTNVYEAGAMQIASAINSVGASSEASEQYLVDFAARLGGSARTARISAPDIIGFGAVLDQMGLQVEMSGTALSNFVIDFVKDTPKFEAAAGMKAGALKKIIGEKGTNEGMLAFIENLKQSTKSEGEFLQKLQDVGIDGSRGAAVFLTLSNNIELVKEQQKLANEEFTKATSVTDEYNKRNNNTAATIEKIGKALKGMFADNIVTRGFESLVGWMGEIMEIPVHEQLEKERKELQLLEYKILSTNTTQEDRIKLINDLQSKYPDIFKNINAETAGYWEISKALQQVNNKMIDRIVIAKQQAKVDEAAEDAAEVKSKMLEKEADLMKLFNNAKQKYPEMDFTVLGGDYVSRAKYLVEQYRDNQSSFLGMSLKNGDLLIKQLEVTLNSYNDLQQKLKKAENQVRDMSNRKKELAKQLGVDIDNNGSVAPTKIGTTSTAESNAEVEAHKKTEEKKTKNVKSQLEEQKKLREQAKKEEFEAAKEYLDSWALMEELKLSETLKNGLLEKEEYNDLKEQLELQHLEAMKIIYLDYGQDVTNIDQQIIARRIRDNEKSYEELAKRREAVKRKVQSASKAGVLAGVNAGKVKTTSTTQTDDGIGSTDIISLGSAGVDTYQGLIDLIATREDAELASERRIMESRVASFEAQAQAGLISNETYLKEREKLELEFNNKQRAMKQEQWKRDRAARIADAMMNTALGVTSALTVAPPLGLIMAALVGTTGALQVAKIASEPVPEFAGGGYSNMTGASGKRYKARRGNRSGGMYSGATYLVGEENKPEFVVPNWIVAHPSAANLMGALDAAVASKNIGALNGGNNDALLSANLKMMATINARLNEPITAVTNWDNVGYNRYMETYNRSEELAQF